MKECSDIERCVQRLNLKRGSPRDLLAISTTIGVVRDLFKCILSDAYDSSAGSQPNEQSLPRNLTKLLKLNDVNLECLDEIEKAFDPQNVSSSLSQGKFIKSGT
jgi:DNA mismatch repair ATPase MutS